MKIYTYPYLRSLYSTMVLDVNTATSPIPFLKVSFRIVTFAPIKLCRAQIALSLMYWKEIGDPGDGIVCCAFVSHHCAYDSDDLLS